jgi:hypothetical protein
MFFAAPAKQAQSYYEPEFLQSLHRGSLAYLGSIEKFRGGAPFLAAGSDRVSIVIGAFKAKK